MKVVYHPAVQRDVSRILKHYHEVSEHLADEFWDELMTIINAAGERPLRFHPYLSDLRRANLKRFPYHILFRMLPDRIRIIIVRHHRQHPSKGLNRK